MNIHWIVAGGQNTGVFGRVYPVVQERYLDVNGPMRLKLLPGCHETILCSSGDTAQRIADWLNSQVESA